MMQIYGDMTKILHSLLDLEGATSYPAPPYLLFFHSVSRIASWDAAVCGYDSFEKLDHSTKRL